MGQVAESSKLSEGSALIVVEGPTKMTLLLFHFSAVFLVLLLAGIVHDFGRQMAVKRRDNVIAETIASDTPPSGKMPSLQDVDTIWAPYNEADPYGECKEYYDIIAATDDENFDDSGLNKIYRASSIGLNGAYNYKKFPLVNCSARLDKYQATVYLTRLECTDINFRDLYGCTPLLYGAANGNVQICKWLLENGAKVNTVCYCHIPKFGAGKWTALGVAVYKDYGHVVDCLVEVEDIDVSISPFETPLPIAAWRNQCLGSFLSLLQSKDALETVDENGNTPIHLWAKEYSETKEYHSAISQQISNVLRLHPHLCVIKNANGRTPLHLAASGVHLCPINILVACNRGTMHSVDNLGHMPLDIALESRSYDVAKLLVLYGSKLHMCPTRPHAPYGLLEYLTEHTIRDDMVGMITSTDDYILSDKMEKARMTYTIDNLVSYIPTFPVLKLAIKNILDKNRVAILPIGATTLYHVGIGFMLFAAEIAVALPLYMFWSRRPSGYEQSHVFATFSTVALLASSAVMVVSIMDALGVLSLNEHSNQITGAETLVLVITLCANCFLDWGGLVSFALPPLAVMLLIEAARRFGIGGSFKLSLEIRGFGISASSKTIKSLLVSSLSTLSSFRLYSRTN